MPNRLASESSPYLRQHASNPVDWFPWGPEAFAKAQAEQKPIFLSIGYSTCHWCHVMARESFENPAIAALLNEDFVSIKLDREERPDVDRVYMAYLQAISGHGGWPLSAWLTPELKPFYAGTYFTPEDRQGRAGFPTILKAIARGWREDRARVIDEGNRAVESLKEHVKPGTVTPSDPLAESAGNAFEVGFGYYAETFDGRLGGFGVAPKFPRASNLSFLLHCAALQGTDTQIGHESVNMVSHTLGQMARGGIHDHVGGGFHRYSVDAEWFVPHFEKMLYDQAQIALNALEAWQATGDERFAWLVRDILDYCLRELKAPEGGFYSAEDADSDRADGTHAEGAYYVWTMDELRTVLGKDADFVALHYGCKEGGNVAADRDPHHEFTGHNILAQVQPLDVSAAHFKLPLQEASDILVRSLASLRQARASRPRPHRDEKIITAWNGLMLSALARAGACPAESLSERAADYRKAALDLAAFMRDSLHDPKKGLLLRSWRSGEAAIEGFAEDYAFLIQGLLDLYEATFDASWLRWAENLQQVFDALFYDPAEGGYFNSAAGATDIVLRLKEDYDGAEPAPSSIAALNLLRMSAIFHDDDFRDRGRKTIEGFRPRWLGVPQALPQMLCALEPALEPPRHVVIVGDRHKQDFQALTAVLASQWGKRRAVIGLGQGPDQEWLLARAPWLQPLSTSRQKATAYVCEAFTCKEPTSDPSTLKSHLA